MSTRTLAASHVLVALLATARTAAGQQPVPAALQAGPPQEPPALALHLEKGKDFGPGAVAAAEGRATTAEPVRFVVNDLSAAQQVSVVLVARNAADRLKVTLAKFGWDENLRSATTDADGRATILLRTQGDLKINVTSAGAGEALFLLAVWAGDELEPPVESFLVPVKEYARRGSVARWAWWIGIGLGGLALLALGLLIGRRKRGEKVT